GAPPGAGGAAVSQAEATAEVRRVLEAGAARDRLDREVAAEQQRARGGEAALLDPLDHRAPGAVAHHRGQVPAAQPDLGGDVTQAQPLGVAGVDDLEDAP